MSDDLRIYNPHLSTPHLLYIVFYQNKEIVILRLCWGDFTWDNWSTKSIACHNIFEYYLFRCHYMCHKNNKNNVVDTTLEEIKRRHICYIRRISDKTSNGLNIPCFTAIDPINSNRYLDMYRFRFGFSLIIFTHF